jgi:hypothetical protein
VVPPPAERLLWTIPLIAGVIDFMMGRVIRWRGHASGIVMVASGALCLSACAGSGSASGSKSPPQKQLSIQEYGTALRSALQPLESALEDLDKAKAYKGLPERVTAVRDGAAQAATRLSQIQQPPTEVGLKNMRLITAVQQFQRDVNDVSTDVDQQGVCTGAAARARMGDANGTKALRDAMAAVNATLSGDRPAFSVYVRGRKKYTVKGVRDGEYTIFFTAGADWDGKARAFGRDCAFMRLGDPTKFRTVRTATQIRWTTWEVTLHSVVGGTGRIDDVDPDDYPE